MKSAIRLPQNQMSKSLIVLCRDEAATDALGAATADAISSGITIALNGQLGSGKTRFVRALCQRLGIDTSTVNSPTFVILQLYSDGRIPVAHMDTYRLADTDEFLAIGAEEFLFSDEWLNLVEWAERVEPVLPEDRIEIRIVQTAELQREFTLTSSGPRSRSILEAMVQAGYPFA